MRQLSKSLQFALSSIVILFSCSPKLRYPVEEINRPLSLPPKNWGVSLGLGPGYYHSKSSSYFYTAGMANIPFGYLLPMFAYPFLPINDKLELHFTLLNLKYYPIKNTKVIDSTLCINGPNLAIGGGLRWFNTSGGPLNFFFQFKNPLTMKSWLFSHGFIVDNVFPDNSVSGQFEYDAEFGFGFQVTPRLYSTLSIGVNRYKSTEKYSEFGFSYVEKYDYWSFRLPMQWGYNLNKKWKMFCYGDVSYLKPEAISTNWALGFDFYW
jgi:hypothetical protein